MQNNDFEDLKRLMIEGNIDGDDLLARYEKYASIDDEKALSQLKELILKQQETKEDSHSATIVPLSRKYYRYAAAAVVAVLIVGGLFWYRQYTKVTPPTLSQETMLAMEQSRQKGYSIDIAPRPFIPEKNGERRAVSGESVEDWIEEAVEMIQQPSASSEERPLHIDTREGKEYWLTLSDGSLVHMNHNTRVIYPETFGHSSRDVILDGEAYFMVAKDKSRPFTVHTPQGSVKVYGTEFMVSTGGETRQSENTTEVVLIEGSISVTPTNGTEHMLVPGQMATLNSNLSSAIIHTVDTAPYKAWNTGTFVFDNIPLQQLMDVLSHWYGFQVVFLSDAAREKHFTGELDRYGSIQPSLTAISSVTGLELNVQNGTIFIK